MVKYDNMIFDEKWRFVKLISISRILLEHIETKEQTVVSRPTLEKVIKGETHIKNKRFYRGKYVIGIYNTEPDDDMCIALLDNVQEFAKFYGTTTKTAKNTLSKIFIGKFTRILYEGRFRDVMFLEAYDGN